MDPIEIIIRLPKRIRWATAQQIIGHCAQRVAQSARDAGVGGWPGHAVLHGMGGRRYRVYWKVGEDTMSDEQVKTPTKKLPPGGGHYVSKEMLGTHEATIIRDVESGQILDTETWWAVLAARVEQLTEQIAELDDGDGEPCAESRELEAERRALKWALAIQAAPVKTLKHISV